MNRSSSKGHAATARLHAVVCGFALTVGLTGHAAANPGLDDDWMPPWEVADLHRAPDGSIYWTATHRTPELNAEPTLWRIEIDRAGLAGATQQIAFPLTEVGQPRVLGVAYDGGAWWMMRCDDPKPRPWCGGIVRTHEDGTLIGWAPPLVGMEAAPRGAPYVDAGGDLIVWRTVPSEEPRNGGHETVFERWRLATTELWPIGRSGDARSRLEEGETAVDPWTLDASYTTPRQWSEQARRLDELDRERRLQRLRETRSQEPFCGSSGGHAIGPGVIAFVQIGCDESRFAVYRMGRSSLELQWESIVPFGSRTSGPLPHSPIRWNPESPTFGHVSGIAVGSDGTLALLTSNVRTFHSPDEPGALIFFDTEGRLSGGLDVERKIFEMKFDTSGNHSGTPSGTERRLFVSEAAPRGTLRGYIARVLTLEGKEAAYVAARPDVWDQELEDQRSRARRLTADDPLDDWLALYAWAPWPDLHERIADEWAETPDTLADRLGDRALRQAAEVLCARHPDSAPESMLERFREAAPGSIRALTWDSPLAGATLIEATGQAAWLVVLAKCFPTPESAPPDALALAQSWRGNQRLRRYAEIALEVWIPGDERADELWRSMRRIANREQLEREPLARRVAEATESNEASLLTGMFPKSRARIEQGLHGDELGRGMAMEIAAFVAQAARQGILGTGPGSAEVEPLVDVLRAWSSSDHAATADTGTLLWLGLTHDLDLESPPPSEALRSALRRSMYDPILLAIAEMNLQFAARHHLDPEWRARHRSAVQPDAEGRAGTQQADADGPSFLQWVGLTDADVQPWLRHLFDLRLDADRRSEHQSTTGQILAGEEPPDVATHLLQALGDVGQQELMRYLRAVQAEFDGRSTGLRSGSRFWDLGAWVLNDSSTWQEEDLELVLALAETATDSREAECRLLTSLRLADGLPASIGDRAARRADELMRQAEDGEAGHGADRWLPICQERGASE